MRPYRKIGIITVMARDESAPGNTDIDVLREMVRLAENRRKEELENVERVNRYNLALIAFSGSFLSLLVTAKFDLKLVKFAGIFLILSIISSLWALRPRNVQGGTLLIAKDIDRFNKHEAIPLHQYLFETASLTESAATSLTILSKQKKWWTLISVILLAISLAITYYLYAYA